MDRFRLELKEFFQKGDRILLLLCVVTSALGCFVISSTTQTMGSARYIIIQIATTVMGVGLYAAVSSIDTNFFSEHRRLLAIFNTVFLFMLVPFGKEIQGNRSWLSLAFLPFDIQVAEVCKITYILIMASVMNTYQNRINSVKSVSHMVAHFLLAGGLSYVLSGDLGVTLIYVFIFVGMTFAGGLSMWLFAAAAGIVALGFPLAWQFFFSDYQKLRIEAIFNPELDAAGTGVRHQTVRALRSLTGGGMTGQGLYEGTRTQTRNALYAQHTDFIFCAVGEELGFLGCLLIVVLLLAIVIRIIWVGTHSPDYMRRLVCFGVAAAMIFQITSNIGMCLGITPVIGLTLPFISYGGSSLLSLYVMMGLVSGIHARPSPQGHDIYIRPPLPKVY